MKPGESEFTPGQMALIEQVAFKVGDVIAGRLERYTKTEIRDHASNCPVKEKVTIYEATAKGSWKTVVVIATIFGAIAGFLMGAGRSLVLFLLGNNK